MHSKQNSTAFAVEVSLAGNREAIVEMCKLINAIKSKGVICNAFSWKSISMTKLEEIRRLDLKIVPLSSGTPAMEDMKDDC
jgi:hypothetical protein